MMGRSTLIPTRRGEALGDGADMDPEHRPVDEKVQAHEQRDDRQHDDVDVGESDGSEDDGLPRNEVGKADRFQPGDRQDGLLQEDGDAKRAQQGGESRRATERLIGKPLHENAEHADEEEGPREDQENRRDAVHSPREEDRYEQKSHIGPAGEHLSVREVDERRACRTPSCSQVRSARRARRSSQRSRTAGGEIRSWHRA